MLESVYLVLIVVIIVTELIRQKENKIDFLTMFSLAFILWYPLPGFLIAFDIKEAVEGGWDNVLPNTNSWQTATAIFLGYFLVVKGFYSKSARTLGKKIVIKSRNNGIIFCYATSLLLFSLASMQIYSSAFGGISNALTQGLAARSGWVSTGTLGFFMRFLSGTGFSSYLLASFVLEKNTGKHKLLKIVLFLGSVVSALISFMLRAGRLNIIYYVLGFYQIYILKNKRIPWLSSAVFIVFMAVFVFYGKNLFSSLSAIPDGFDAVIDRFNQSMQDNAMDEGFNFYGFISNFYYTVFSLDTAFSKSYDFRWFIDILYGILTLVPDRLLGSESPETVLYYNTVFIVGSFDYAIPTGFLAFGIYSLWWPGLVIVCLTYGWIGGCLQSTLEKHLSDVFWMPYFYALVAQIWVFFQGSDPESFFQSNFMLLAASFLLMALGTKILIVRHDKKISSTKGN
jgi:oligosaccharide repeat unit polymerase